MYINLVRKNLFAFSLICILSILALGTGCGRVWGHITSSTDAGINHSTTPLLPLAFFQENDNTAAPCGVGASCPVSFLNPSVATDLIVVAITYNTAAPSVSSVTDTQFNTYLNATGVVNWPTAPARTEIWYALNVSAGGVPITITTNFSAPTTFATVYANEFQGVTNIDQPAVATGNTASPISSGFKTTVYPNEIIFGHSEGQGPVVTLGAGFNLITNNNANIEEYNIVGSINSYDAHFGLSAPGEWIAIMTTFR